MTVIKTIALLLFLGSVAHARDMWISSYTVTADTATLCGGGKRGFFHGLCVTTVTGGASLKVYNSSFTTTNKILTHDMNHYGCQLYDILAPNGLYYIKLAAAGAVVMLYQCY